MKSFLIFFSFVVLAGQAHAATAASKRQNCIDTVGFAMNVDSLDAAVACSYGQGAQFVNCTIEVAQTMGESYLATAGYLCGQTTDGITLSCAAHSVVQGKSVDVALKRCQ